MESSILLPVSEDQVIALARQLKPDAKRGLLQNLIPEMDTLDSLVDYGNERIRVIAASRGMNWDQLSEVERMDLLDAIVHEPPRD